MRFRLWGSMVCSLGEEKSGAWVPDPLPQSDLLRSEQEGGLVKGLRAAVVPLSLPPGSESLEDSRDVRNQNGLPGPYSCPHLLALTLNRGIGLPCARPSSLLSS